MCFWMSWSHLQWDVVGNSLGLYEVFGLVLRDYMPADAIVDAVLKQHGPVYGVSLIQSYVTAVCLCHAADLQHKHDLTVKEEKKGIKETLKVARTDFSEENGFFFLLLTEANRPTSVCN